MRRTILAVTLILLMSLSLVVPAYATGHQDQITRIEFVQLLLEAMDVELKEVPDFSFEDIEDETVAILAETANEKGFISGYGGQFYPNDPITREQGITILVRVFAAGRLDNAGVEEGFGFKDEAELSPWARPYIPFALDYHLIEMENQLRPQAALSLTEAQQMIQQGKAAYIELNTRDGLTAYEMLQKAEETLLEFDTYQFRGVMEMATVAMTPEGQEVMLSEMTQEGKMKTPSTVYVKTTGVSTIGEEVIEEMSEVYMEEGTMYLRPMVDGEWIQIDLNPLMEQLEGLMGAGQQGAPQMSQQQLEVFGLYARFDEDIEIDGQKYYVITIDVNSEIFMEIYEQILDQTMDYLLQEGMLQELAGGEDIPEELQGEMFQEMMKQMVKSMLENMEIEMTQSYFIHSDTYIYEQLTLSQTMRMLMGPASTEIQMTGTYQYHGFNEEVSFPEIVSYETIEQGVFPVQ